jgi:hypothetical protein
MTASINMEETAQIDISPIENIEGSAQMDMDQPVVSRNDVNDVMKSNLKN